MIPLRVLKRLGWREGEELIVEEVEGALRLSRAKLSAADVAGIGRKYYRGPTVSIEEMDRAARGAVGHRK